MHHAAEIKPLTVVAPAAKAPSTGKLVAAACSNALPGRCVGACRNCLAILPKFILRASGKARCEPLMRSQQTVDPAGRTAAAGNDRDNLREHIKSVFETAIVLGLEDAKQVGFAHAVDHIVGHA